MTDFIAQHRRDDVSALALARHRYASMSDEDFRWALQQIDGWQRTEHKLPEIAQNGEWWYPVRVSCEQCSSEAAAKYKAEVLRNMHLPSGSILADLTGGFGIDTWYMHKQISRTEYIERDAELCRIAAHNFGADIAIHHSDAISYLTSHPTPDVLYIDPARRNTNGNKVFLIEDCEPDITQILPLIPASTIIMLKLSPMLDISAAINTLGGIWQTHVVAINNEVKEVLLVRHPNPGTTITAVDLKQTISFSFSRTKEASAQPQYANLDDLAPDKLHYLYEPNVSLLKAGAYNLLSERYGVHKLAPNTHLYASAQQVVDFPGKTFVIREVGLRLQALKGMRVNVITRNYPMRADQLRASARLSDGGEQYIIGTRVGQTPILLLADRLA